MTSSLSPSMALHLAQIILGLHLVVIVFNVSGLVLIPLGAWRYWPWVRRLGWRVAHLAALSLVAIQAVWGRACFLTVWQSDLMAAAGRRGYTAPLIQTWVDRLMFWNLPMAFFTALYVLVWLYVLALWHWVPPRRNKPASR